MASFPFIKDDLEIITIISNQACLKQKILLASIRSDPTCVWQSTHILCFMVHRKGFTKHLMTVNFLKLARELTHPFFFFLKGVVSIMKYFQHAFWENFCPLKSDFPFKKHSANHWVNFISQLPLKLHQLFFTATGSFI